LLVLNTLFIIVASTVPAGPEAPAIPYLDKICHFAAYLTLSFFIFYGFENLQKRVVLLVAGIGLGIAMESIPFFLPSRDASALDEVTNAAGLVAGMLVFWMIKKVVSLQVARERNPA
jgi:VanZ family protein